ncbi:MAG: septal ring lytic transglycosylase RlpA family protein [Desulfovibrio sp.]|nr:septal ring lytic transglycosylase RlpA family protein [Desulfovibrio sp.]
MHYLCIVFTAIALLFGTPTDSLAASKKQKNHIEQAQRKHHRSHVRKASPSTPKKHVSRKHLSRKHASRKSPTKKTKSSPRTSWVEHAQQAQLSGKASWYGRDFHGGPTASGMRYDMYTFTAAHKTLPLGTIVKVTTPDSGKSVVVCVTDRGPFVQGRVIDLSYAAATQLGIRKKGVGKVNLEVVCNANGEQIKKSQAFYVQYRSANKLAKTGPFTQFADACAMQEALSKAHPEAKVIVDKKSESAQIN